MQVTIYAERTWTDADRTQTKCIFRTHSVGCRSRRERGANRGLL